MCRTRIKFSAGIDRHPRSRAPDTDQTKEAMAIIDRSLIHKYIVMAVTDRPAAHEHMRSLTTIVYPSHGRTCRAKEIDCANQQEIRQAWHASGQFAALSSNATTPMICMVRPMAYVS